MDGIAMLLVDFRVKQGPDRKHQAKTTLFPFFFTFSISLV